MAPNPFSVFTLTTLIVAFARITLYGQSIKQEVSFPTYQQIKPTTSEIVDYVSPRGSLPADVQNLLQARINQTNLFDYPAGTVTYILNNQPTTDVEYVKQVLDNKSISIESVLIGQPDDNQKRTIRIEYRARE